MARRVLGDDPFATNPKPPAPPPRAKKPPPPKKPPAPKKSAVAAKKPDAPAADVTAPSEAPPVEAPVVEAPTAPAVALTVGEKLQRIEAEFAALRSQHGDDPAVLEALSRIAPPPPPEAPAVEPEAPVEAPAATTFDFAPALARDEAVDPTDLDVARELMSSEYYLRRWGRVAMRDRAEEVDEFGYDPSVEARWRPLLDFLFDRWLRVQVEGVENVPSEGRVCLVANHGGALPFDGVMLAAALRKEHPAARQLRWLAEDFVFHFPFAGTHLNRLGAVRACQENAERLLARDACVGLFPEGVKGLSKTSSDRYKLQRFGRGGHIKLAMRTRTPIVPVTIVGAEDAIPLIGASAPLARLLSLPYFPITPTFPWLGPLGLMPLPARWKIIFGEVVPMDLYDPSQADDEVLVGRLNERVRATIQETLDAALRTRGSVYRG